MSDESLCLSVSPVVFKSYVVNARNQLFQVDPERWATLCRVRSYKPSHHVSHRNGIERSTATARYYRKAACWIWANDQSFFL